MNAPTLFRPKEPTLAADAAAPAASAPNSLVELVFAAVILLACFSPAAKAMQLLFAPLCALMAYYLIRKSHTRFVVFVLYLWFFSPFVRRVADLQAGFRDPSPMLLAPILASGVAVVGLARQTRLLFTRNFLPFTLSFLALSYGLLVGLLKMPVQAALTDFSRWTVPVLFASYCYSLQGDREELIERCKQAFIYGLIIMSVYGIWQSISPPAWDSYWLSNMGAGSFGTADGSKVRVFSTMNSPGPFAATVMGGVLLLMTSTKWPARIAQVLGVAVVLLSEVRSAWIGGVVGFAYIFARSSAKTRLRMLAFAAVSGVILSVALTFSGSTQKLTSRFDTFTDIKQDESFGERLAGSRIAIAHALGNPFGGGMGYLDSGFFTDADAGGTDFGNHDNGFFECLATIGVLGCLLYAAGIILMLVKGASLRGGFASEKTAFVAVCLCFLAQMPTGNALFAVNGVVFWLAAALLLLRSDYDGKALPLPARHRTYVAPAGGQTVPAGLG